MGDRGRRRAGRPARPHDRLSHGERGAGRASASAFRRLRRACVDRRSMEERRRQPGQATDGRQAAGEFRGPSVRLRGRPLRPDAARGAGRFHPSRDEVRRSRPAQGADRRRRANGKNASRVIAALSAIAALAVAFVTAASYSRDWRLALIAHFRLHLAAAAWLALLATAMVDLPAGPKLVLLLAAFGAAVVNLGEMILRTPRGSAAVGDRRLCVAFANVLKNNPDAGRLVDWVRREKVDVLVVAESEASWPSRLAVLADELPFGVRTRVGDVAVYSRHEIAGEPHHIFPNIGHAIALEVAGITLVGLHTAAPVNATHSKACNELIDRAADHVEGL